MTRKSRQQVMIDDVPEDDDGTTLPPLPPELLEEFGNSVILDAETGQPTGYTLEGVGGGAGGAPRTDDGLPPGLIQPYQSLEDLLRENHPDYQPNKIPPSYIEVNNELASGAEGQRSYIDSVNDGTLAALHQPPSEPVEGITLRPPQDPTTGAASGDITAIPPGTGSVPAIPRTQPLDDGTGNPHTLDALGPLAPLEGEITPPPKPDPTKPRYEQRIRIVEAWQFVEGIARAPHWIDKNWAAWGDDDPLRGIPSGPAIKVPGAGGTMVARHGDYIARQLITLVPGLPPEERIEVWPRESFEKFFIRGAG